MRLLPPIRTRRWIWFAITVLIAAAWIGSAEHHVIWTIDSNTTYGAGLSEGRVAVLRWGSEVDVNSRPIWLYQGRPELWLPECVMYSPRSGIVFVPLWPFSVACGLMTVLAFRRARRLRAANTCPACAYSLAGLAPNSPCPECGAPHAAGVGA